MSDNFLDHSKSTWDHVLHLNASSGEYLEAGAEVVGTIALAAVVKSAGSKLLSEAWSEAEAGGSAARQALSTEASLGSEIKIPGLKQEAGLSINPGIRTAAGEINMAQGMKIPGVSGGTPAVNGRALENALQLGREPSVPGADIVPRNIDKVLPLDGKQSLLARLEEGFYRPSPAEQETLSLSELSSIAQSNQGNLVARVAAFGDDFPRLAFHSCSKLRADQLEAALANGEDVSRYLALPVKEATTAEGKLADLTASFKHASMGGYNQGDPMGKVFVFDASNEQFGHALYIKGNGVTQLPAPFRNSLNAGEVANWPLSEKTKPVFAFQHSSLQPYQPDIHLPDYFERIKWLEPIDYQTKMDDILSAVEKSR